MISTFVSKLSSPGQEAFVNAARNLQTLLTRAWQIPGHGQVFVFDGIDQVPENGRKESYSDKEEERRALLAVAKNAGASVVVVRNPDGHIQIFCPRNITQRLLTRVRTRENFLRGRPQQPFEALSAPGTLAEAPEWYGDPAGWVLNTTRNPRTLLTPENIDKIITQVFDDAWWGNWLTKNFKGQFLTQW